MRKRFLIGFILLCLIGSGGCTKIETGAYQEGTYYAFDEETQYSVTMYVNEKGMIKSVFFDAIHIVDCAEYGVLDDTCTLTTKQALGTKYGMKSVSKIEKEWYEQVAAFGAKVVAEQGIDWLQFKYRVDAGSQYEFTETAPSNDNNAQKTYTDSVSGVTIHVDNLYRLITDVLKQAQGK